MKKITAEGKTVEVAVEIALDQLKTTREKVDIEIIDSGKKGLFGLFGNRLAVVSVTLKRTAANEAQKYLEGIITAMDVPVTIEKAVNGREIIFQLSGEKVALLIGKRGITLNHLQYLTQLVANRYSSSYVHVTVDAENYREKRKQILDNLAKKVAMQALRTGKEIALEPMPSFERKVIHHALAKNKAIKTYSTGNDPYRHIVVLAKENPLS